MACARNTNIQNSDELGNYISNSLLNNTRNRSSCRRYKSGLSKFYSNN